MYVLDETDECNSFIYCTNNENDDIIIIIEYLLLSITSGVLLLPLITIIIYKMIETLIIG